jgi:adenylate cyclase
LSLLYCYHREYDKGLAEGERSVDLDPNGADTLYNYGWVLFSSGRTDEAISFFEKAIRLNPNGPFYFFSNYGDALRAKRRFDDSISAFKKALQRKPNAISAHLGLAVTYSLMGRNKGLILKSKKSLGSIQSFRWNIAKKSVRTRINR